MRIHLRARPAALLLLLAPFWLGADCGSQPHDRNTLQAMIDAAGPGGEVVFPVGVHRICKALRALPGQTWDLSAATLRRCDAVVTTLLEDAPAGSMSVRVADTTGFEPGQRVTPVKEPGHSGGDAQVPHWISSVVGDVIHFSNGLLQDYQAGDSFLVIEPIVMSAPGGIDGFTLRGGIIDGNRRGNPHFVAWEVAPSLQFGGQGVVLEDVVFRDCWGDCIKANAATDSTVRRVRFVGGSTAAIHLTLVERLRIESSVFSALNQDAKLAEHSEGAVTWSSLNRGITIQDSCFEDIPSDQAMGALAHTNFQWNSEVYVYDNQFCRVPAIWTGHLSAEPRPGFDPTGIVEIVGNYAVDAGLTRVRVRSTLASSVFGVVFAQNVLVNAAWDFSEAHDPIVQGNVVLPAPAECSCDSWLAP